MSQAFSQAPPTLMVQPLRSVFSLVSRVCTAFSFPIMCSIQDMESCLPEDLDLRGLSDLLLLHIDVMELEVIELRQIP